MSDPEYWDEEGNYRTDWNADPLTKGVGLQNKTCPVNASATGPVNFSGAVGVTDVEILAPVEKLPVAQGDSRPVGSVAAVTPEKAGAGSAKGKKKPSPDSILLFPVYGDNNDEAEEVPSPEGGPDDDDTTKNMPLPEGSLIVNNKMKRIPMPAEPPASLLLPHAQKIYQELDHFRLPRDWLLASKINSKSKDKGKGRASFLKLNGIAARMDDYIDYESSLERVFAFGKSSLEYREDVVNIQKELGKWPPAREYNVTPFSPRDEMDAILREMAAGGKEAVLWLKSFHRYADREKKKKKEKIEEDMELIAPFLDGYEVDSTVFPRHSVQNYKGAKLSDDRKKWLYEATKAAFVFRFSDEYLAFKARGCGPKRQRTEDE